MFQSVEDVQQHFKNARYIANRRISTVVFLAARMGRPVLIEGPGGRRQDRAGQDAGRRHEPASHPPAVLRGARRGQGALRVEVRQAAPLHPAPEASHRRADRGRAVAARGGRAHLGPGRRVLLRPLPRAAPAAPGDRVGRPGRAAGRRDRQGRPRVRGIPARGPVRLPGHRCPSSARSRPRTSRSWCSPRTTRASCPTALKRRCLHLFIDFPPADEELAIIRLKVPEVSERLAQTVVAAVQRIRGLELRKAPSISESLDWARSLVILNADALDPELVESTLTMLVKHEKDIERVKGALDKVLADAGARPMDQRILEFIGDLRRAELRISPSEALDALGRLDRDRPRGPRDVQGRARHHAGQGVARPRDLRPHLRPLLPRPRRRSARGSRRPSAPRIPRSRRCSTGWPPRRASSWTSSPSC